MKRLALFGLIIVVIGGGVFAYYQYGGSPEIRRESYLKKGQDYLKQSKLNEAIAAFRNAVKADPRSAEARFELAIALLRRGDGKGGYGELVRAVDLKPEFIKARYQLALLLLQTRDIARAKEHLEILRQNDRNSFVARYLAAKIALVERLPDKALTELTAITDADPEKAFIYVDIGVVYFAAKNFRSAEEAFRKALEISPKLSSARVGLAQLYVYTGNQEKAEAELIRATQEDPENESLLHLLGLLYARVQKINEFENIYLELVKKKPNSLIAKKRLAEVYITKGQTKQAQFFIDEILRDRPGDPDGHFFRGRLKLANRELQKAAEDFTITTQNAPRLAPGFYYLGIVQLSLMQADNAKRNLLKAVELRPNWLLPRVAIAQLYAASGDTNLALEQSELVLKAQPQNDLMLTVSGAAHLRMGEVDKALNLFKKAKALNPKSHAVRMNIGTAYLAKKQYADAIREYDEILNLSPDRIEALASIVRIYNLQGDTKKAFDRAERHVAKTSNKAGVYQLIGQLKLGNKEYKQSIEYFQKAIDLNPNLASAYLQIASAYAAQKQFDSAIAQYDKIIAKTPNAIPPLMMAAVLYDRKRQPEKANHYYKKILDINKNFVPAANNLAWNYAENGGHLDVALGLAQRARELDPDDPGVADTLGWISYKKRLYPTAVNLLRESNTKLKESNPEVLYHLGMAYHKNGDNTLAAEALNKALASPNAFNGKEEAKKTLAEIKSRPR
jgi:tetratricopeptide (TPR) repeat protein